MLLLGTLFCGVVLALFAATWYSRVVLMLYSYLDTPPDKRAKELHSLLCLEFRIMGIMAANISGSISIAAASQNIAPQSWVLDSGAPFHVPSNKTQLIDCKQIVDGTTIHTADGTSHVTHEGTFSTPHFYVPDITFGPSIIYEFVIRWSNS